MKTLSAFFIAFAGLASFFLPCSLQAQTPRFVGTPVIERFGSGGLEWTASVSCADPVALLGSRIVYSFDADLDGVGDTSGVYASSIAATSLSPGDCVNGVLPVRRSFVLSSPSTALPAVLRAELWLARTPGDSLADSYSLLTGPPGSLLSLRTFCASPKNGEPEWVEIRNVSTVTVSLNRVRLEGRALSGSSSSGSASSASSASLGPGESLTAFPAADSAAMRLWRPGARTVPLASWPGLRNSGDTIRLGMETAEAPSSKLPTRIVSLDSVSYGTGGSGDGDAREACASAPDEESTAAAQGYGIEIPAGRWRRSAGPLSIQITAPEAPRAYDLKVYDFDGFRLCDLARRAQGSQSFSLSSVTCPGLSNHATALILLLRPSDAPSLRRVVRVNP